MEGYIKLHRKILDNGIFRKPNVSHLFNYCLLRANWSDKTICWNGQPLVVERGSFITGRKQISQDTGLSEQNVRSALRTLQHFSMVQKSTSKSTSKFTYLTVCNYNDYQHLDDETNQVTNQEATSNQPATNQEATTNKNNNNKKKKETNKNINPAFENWWTNWRARSRDNPGTKNLAEKHWRELNKTLSAEQIEKATDNYLKDVGLYHKAAERFLNPKDGLVKQNLEDKPPKPSAKPDREIPTEPDYTNVYKQVRLALAKINSREELVICWENLSDSWQKLPKVQQMFKDKS